LARWPPSVQRSCAATAVTLEPTLFLEINAAALALSSEELLEHAQRPAQPDDQAHARGQRSPQPRGCRRCRACRHPRSADRTNRAAAWISNWPM
jgi:hypothetical protein